MTLKLTIVFLTFVFLVWDCISVLLGLWSIIWDDRCILYSRGRVEYCCIAIISSSQGNIRSSFSSVDVCLYKCKPKFATISSSDLDLFYFVSRDLGTYAVVHPSRGCDFLVFDKLLFFLCEDEIMAILNPASTPVIPDDDTSQQQHTDIISDYEPRQGLAVV